MGQNAEPSPDWSAVDWIKVGRLTHELSVRHGWFAHGYAEKVAAQARVEKDVETANFWSAVAISLRPRAESPG